MSVIQALLLGLLQGITEFLPVSSSGHLAVLQYLWRLPEHTRMPLAAVLHIGTTVALVGYFWRQLGNILTGIAARERNRRTQSWRTVGYIAVGSVPAAVVGLLLEERLEAAFSEPFLVGVMLLVTGGFLFATRFFLERDRQVGWLVAFAIGVAQAFAILPGISRSGVTIATAIFLGLRRKDAFEFSFILSVPIIIAAATRELVGINYSFIGVWPIAVGIGMAFLSGVAALMVLKRVVLNRRLHWFAFYCWVAGMLVIFLVR